MLIKPFQLSLRLLLCWMIASMSISGCGCNNPPSSKFSHAKNSIEMKVTPVELKGDQRTVKVTFIPKTPGKPDKPILLARYQLQIIFPENTQIYYTSSKQIKEEVRKGEKIKLEKLLGTQQISSGQDIKLTIVPNAGLHSLEIQLKLLDDEDQESQNSTVRWKHGIRLELGYDKTNSKVIYALANEADNTLVNIQLRYTNISANEEGKKVLLDGQLSSSLPIPELVGRENTENQYVLIDFKDSQKATFRFDVIDQKERVLITTEKVFSKDLSEDTESMRALQEIFQELKKANKDIDKIKRLVSQPGFPINQELLYVDNSSGLNQFFDSYYNAIHRHTGKYTVISMAAEENELELVEWLIEQGAEVNSKSGIYGPLELAAKKGSEALIRVLLQAGAHINGSSSDTQYTPVELAIQNRNVPMLWELLKSAQIDVSKQDKQGSTMLHDLALSCYYDHKKVIFFDNEDNKNKRKKKIQEILQIVKEVISKGADVNKQTDSGDSPLLEATKFPSEAIEVLLNMPNIQVDLQNKKGYTPLHNLVNNYLDEKNPEISNIFSNKKDPEILNNLSQQISLLIQQGARIDLRTKPWKQQCEEGVSVDFNDNSWVLDECKRSKKQAGKSVLEIAEESGDQKLIELLKGKVH